MIDGGSYGPTVNFTDLGPGNHTIEVLDDNGCHYAQTILIENPKEVKVELGTNKVIAEGDIVTISPDISINIKDANIVWSSNPEGTSCNDCPQLTVEPTITTVYNVVVTNENGCVAEDSIEIRVKSVIRVFIPTAISPNNDGINDVFYIQTDRNVTRINKLVIFNRWGDVQFSIEDTPPDDPAYGWNGRFGEQKTNTPAVFVYLAVVTLRDGRQLTYKGDITVVR
ncbi:MAG: gliding motility-associated C-terminal domain-containing protein [Saprospiraceae bacterium]|uniref:T9SS type B sorting domain-containing protein n=1 Tax=Candidatus Brachybacter algidus TaxID=2982024 RepID=UPI00257FA299|nr:gliding motility-associated C-terminal domain-containing protein [Candidatus Brachybacter algidus]MBK7604106.1 gliding motility-associated C-terminal domain-containing protein [Candidatus Brachybacter algidus]